MPIKKPSDEKDSSRFYIAIKELIISGKLHPGEHLVEADLAQRFHVSRTPIRAVLERLKAEGFVEQIPNKGTLVKKHSPQDIVDLWQIREMLEGLSARLAVENVTAKGKKELKDICFQMEGAVKKGDNLEYYGLSGEFHNAVMAMGKNQHLEELLDSVCQKIYQFQFRNLLLPDRPPESLREHKEVMKAILAQDPDLAEQKMRHHVRVTRNLFIKNQKNQAAWEPRKNN